MANSEGLKENKLLSNLLNLPNNQLAVIAASAISRQLVIAGPGTGKTFCLIERLKYLVTEENILPGTEILILSFSVAAVQEIKKRLTHSIESGECEEHLAFANIRTFDSFASHFLLKIESEIELSNKDYDDRINMAIDYISTNNSAIEEISKYKHILIDEVQDLVGVRARLTQKLLEKCKCGFTLFTDPAQSIYDYLVRDDDEEPSSRDFYKWAKGYFKDLLVPEEFTQNFRVGTNNELGEIAKKGREILINERTAEARSFLIEVFDELKSLGDLNKPHIPDSYFNQNTAILCRTKGQVLCLSRHLFTLGKEFHIRGPLGDITIPQWVGRIFFGWDKGSIQKSEFLDLFAKRNPSEINRAEDFWEVLKYAEGNRSSSLNIIPLRHALLFEPVFPKESAQHSSGILISTIHRSKGREFDKVIIVNRERDDDDPDQESRVFYVALTRAKSQFFKMSEKGSRGFHKILNEERWVRNFDTKFTGVEVGLRGDIDSHSYVSKNVNDMEDIIEIQEAIWEKVHPLSEALLSFDKIENGCPVYNITINCDNRYITIGKTSQKFGWSLGRCIKYVKNSSRWPSKYPSRITDIWVREIVTEIGQLGRQDIPRELRTSGMWLGIRLEGLGKCEW